MSSKRILVIDHQLDDLRAIAEELTSTHPDWQVDATGKMPAALQLLDAKRYDGILAVSNFVGQEPHHLLKQSRERCPNALRFALENQSASDSNQTTLEIAHQLFSKPMDAPAIRKKMERSLALNDALGNDHLRLVVAQIRQLPTLPDIYLRFLDETRKSLPSIERLADIIQSDISLCSKLLQLANSAYFGVSTTIESPEDAILYLGIEQVKAMVLAVQVFGLFKSGKVAGFNPAALWDHSMETATIARLLARVERLPRQEAEACFTGGLLHDVGKLILVTHLPKLYLEIQEHAGSEGCSFVEAERAVMGSTHAQLGASLLSHWGLPDSIVLATACHHSPADSLQPEFGPTLAVHLANGLAREKGDSAESPDIDSDYLKTLGMEKRINLWRDEVSASRAA